MHFKKLMHVLHLLIIISFIFEKKLLPSSENTVIGNILILTCNHIFSEGIFSYNQLCQHFMKRTGFLAHQRNRRLTTSYFFLIFDGKQHPKIFGSINVKITPDFCSLHCLDSGQKAQDI